MLMLQP